uniref:Protein tyrosine phosphatase receptor type O n=1 Tax=Cyprinus carpio TaxID=7962 RepID=A0A8C1Z4G3_CYPCA
MCLIPITRLSRGAPFQVELQDERQMLLSLDADDVRPDVSVYLVRVSGEPHTHTLLFTRPADGQTLPHPLQFNASYHGLCYSISLMLGNNISASRAVRTVPVLTKPLPLDSIEMSDYGPAPETGVVFQIHSPDRNIYTRVNISYMEGRQPRYMLYKDFLKGKTVFKHWLSGTCYTNISFQLVSEATVNRSTLLSRSEVTHEPLRHRTGTTHSGSSVSRHVIIRASGSDHAADLKASHNASVLRRTRDIPAETSVTQMPLNESVTVYSSTAEPVPDNSTEPLWAEPTGSSAPTEEEEFVNALVPEYEDSNEPGSAMDMTFEPNVMPTPLPPILLELRWLPPQPPTAYDGFNIYIYHDGNSTETATVDENTHEFFTELSEAGTYRVHVTTLSSSGDCEARESSAHTGFTFYLSPAGEWMEQPQERPQAVSVKMLDSSTAAVSWAASRHRYNSSLISVLSLTCLRPSINQRMENTYCSEVLIHSRLSHPITVLTPGAQYRVVVYHRNGPLVSPPSEPIIIDIEPTGVRDLVVYPLSPSELILSWQRPYNVAFRKYILQTFFFNSATQTSQWSTYYEITATASVVASVRVTDLLPAWFYKFRVTMETWSEPALICCDASTVSFVTAPEAPHISWVDYAHGTLLVRWTYGDLFTDLSHSRLLHWRLTAEGKKSATRRYSIHVSLNTTNLKQVFIINTLWCLAVLRTEPAPPKSLYAVNATDTAVTLLWTEDGVVDFYQIVCRPLRVNGESKVRAQRDSLHRNSECMQMQTVMEVLMREMNPSVAAISALAVLSVLLISLLLLFLLLLRKKHLELSRECGAETFVNFASFERDGKLPYNWSKTALKKRKLTSPIQLSDFEAYIKDMSRDSAYKFSLQFEELKSVGLDLSHEAADLPVNRPKNRYTNILPYDFSRVKLISLHNDEGSDYINANFIPGYNSPHEFIATQGPLPETRNDFWNMVLQQKSHIIVMLTQCNERRRVKCDHYWPFTEEPVAYGDITVEMLSETDSPEWTIRNFRLGYADETQDILHFNYTSWPDHGVPTVNAIESILQFVQIVRQQVSRTKGPIVVHCSAGVGRTGTFIALDRLMQHIQEHEYVDVLGLVSDMRSHRLSMVQTEEQYVFIHQCVLLMWKKKKQQTHTSDVIYENVSKS